jgi:cytochrome c-type biogenesis protein CcmE
MRKRSQRLWLIGVAGVLAAGAIGLAAVALQSTVSFFQSPSDIVAKGQPNTRQSVRVGGLVEVGSTGHNAGGDLVFKITDGANAVPVIYDQVPPDLFNEGQGVIAEGKFDETGRLVASRVLAKHDENYMPKETYEALRKAAESKGAAPATKEPTS